MLGNQSIAVNYIEPVSMHHTTNLRYFQYSPDSHRFDELFHTFICFVFPLKQLCACVCYDLRAANDCQDLLHLRWTRKRVHWQFQKYVQKILSHVARRSNADIKGALRTLRFRIRSLFVRRALANQGISGRLESDFAENKSSNRNLIKVLSDFISQATLSWSRCRGKSFSVFWNAVLVNVLNWKNGGNRIFRTRIESIRIESIFSIAMFRWMQFPLFRNHAKSTAKNFRVAVSPFHNLIEIYDTMCGGRLTVVRAHYVWAHAMPPCNRAFVRIGVRCSCCGRWQFHRAAPSILFVYYIIGECVSLAIPTHARNTQFIIMRSLGFLSHSNPLTHSTLAHWPVDVCVCVCLCIRIGCAVCVCTTHGAHGVSYVYEMLMRRMGNVRRYQPNASNLCDVC